MSEIKTLRAALEQVVDSYLYLTENVGVIADDAYIAAQAALHPQTHAHASESPTEPTALTEVQRVDPYEMVGETPCISRDNN